MRIISLQLQPSLFPLLNAILALFTSGLSVTLTLLWQSKWRTIDRPPFISDAHYDEHQSPIFAVTTTLTAISGLCTALLTWMVSQQRACRRFIDINATCVPPTTVCGRCHLPLRIRGSWQRPLATVALIFGLIATAFLLLGAAVNTKARLHTVSIMAGFGCNLVWAFFVSMTLESILGDHAEGYRQFCCVLGMQLCVVLSFSAVAGMRTMHGNELYFAAAVLEYIFVLLGDVYLVLLSFRLRESQITAATTDTTDCSTSPKRTGQTNGADEREVLVR